MGYIRTSNEQDEKHCGEQNPNRQTHVTAGELQMVRDYIDALAFVCVGIRLLQTLSDQAHFCLCRPTTRHDPVPRRVFCASQSENSVSGSQMRFSSRGNSKLWGITPITCEVTPSISSVCPRTLEEPPNLCCQMAWLRTTTRAFCSSSLIVKVRPNSGGTPKTLKRFAEARTLMICSGSVVPVKVTDVGSNTANSSNELFWVRHSEKLA